VKQTHDTVVILDFGAINSQAAAKLIRQLNIYCEVLPCTAARERIEALRPKALVLQRGAEFGANTLKRSPATDPAAWGVPVLDLSDLPCEIATFETFLLSQCGLRQDWTVEAFIREAIDEIRGMVGSHRVLLAMSGGVDSSVCALLAHRAVGDRLTCVFVDHGLMRKGESDEVCSVFRDRFGIPLRHVDAAERFLARLAGITDPEHKRKIIGEEFIRVFEEEASKFGGSAYLAQGTIYPDVIESGDGGEVVKSHHNVGGLPENIDFVGIVEPLNVLFKEEVRAVGRALGLPSSLVDRQPFPGPGLAIRCLGGITREKLHILREADAIFRDAIVEHCFPDLVSQYFAVMTGLQSVGVVDGIRTYDYTIALRAVKTDDFMVARPVEFPWSFLQYVTKRITTEVPHVSRVVYELTGKPPATIEWE